MSETFGSTDSHSIHDITPHTVGEAALLAVNEVLTSPADSGTVQGMNTKTQTNSIEWNNVNGYRLTFGGQSLYVEKTDLLRHVRFFINGLHLDADSSTLHFHDDDGFTADFTLRELLAYLSGGREGTPGVYVNEEFHEHTLTGRRSSEPNLQNIPNRTPTGDKIRAALKDTPTSTF